VSVNCAAKRSGVGTESLVSTDDGGTVQAIFPLSHRELLAARGRAVGPICDVLNLLPSCPEHRLFDLAPVEWTKTRERGDVMALLEKNPFRRLTLDTGR
jgi:hypothetical protein